MKTTEKSIKQILLENDELIAESITYLKQNGIEYSLSEWLTIKKYCERFGIEDTQIVSNWIRRGIVPPENVQIIEELNGLKLIKAIAYK